MVKALYLLTATIAMSVLTLLILILVSSCTYSINMVHTSGIASDVIDETDDVNPDISPTLSLPLVGK